MGGARPIRYIDPSNLATALSEPGHLEANSMSLAPSPPAQSTGADPALPFPNAVEPRCGFRRPRLHIAPLPRDGWDAVAPLPVLIDPHGESVSNDIDLRLAYDDAGLHCRARWTDPSPAVHPERRPGTAKFWQQDHLDLRLAGEVDRAADAVGFLFTLAGTSFDTLDLWKAEAGVQHTPSTHGDQHQIDASIPWSALPFDAPGPGDVRFGLASLVRFKAGPDIATVSPADLGFGQRERFAELHFRPSSEDAPRDAAEVRLDSVRFDTPRLSSGDTPATVELVNHAPAPLDAKLRVAVDRDPAGAAASTVHDLTLAPGPNAVRINVPLERPTYRLIELWADHAGRSERLASMSLRAGPPPPPQQRVDDLAHPYITPDADRLAELRRRAAAEPFAKLCAEVEVAGDDLDPPDLPREGEEPSLLITRQCMGWSRVAKESMIRDGEGGRRKPAAHIWSLQSESARDAWRRTVENVDPADDDLQLLIDEFNTILARPDFYDPDAFADVPLPDDALADLDRGLENLGERELFRFNRIALQNAIECVHNFKGVFGAMPGRLWAKWLVTGDDRLIDVATRAVRAANDAMIPSPTVGLREGMMSGSLAHAYDAFSTRLSDDDRAHWLILLERMIDIYLRTARSRSWDAVCIPNANPVCNGGCGTLALALLHEFPDKAREALHHARTNIRNWLDYCAGPDGGNTEGAQYWQYGTDNFLRFALALEHALGHDDGLLSHPAVRNAMNMPRVSLSNDGAMHGLNDTIPVPKGAAVAWLLGSRFDDPFATWYGDHCLRWFLARRAAGKQTPYHPSAVEMLLDRAPVPEMSRPPQLPVAFALHSIEYAVLRSRPTLDAPLVAFLKGSRPPYTHHNQPDSGALSVHLRGERLLIDPGYYNGQPADHCLPIVDGVGPHQPADYTARLDACGSRGPLRWAACDATPAYRGAARLVRRHIVMLNDRALLLIDDIDPAGTGEVVAQFQAGDATEPADGDARRLRIVGQAAKLDLALLTHPDARFELAPERPFKTHWGYKFSDCRWHPATARYTAASRLPLVAFIADATDGTPKLPALTRDADAAGRPLAMTIAPPDNDAPPIRLAYLNRRWELDLDATD